MGEHKVTSGQDKKELRNFMQQLFKDVRALEIMVKNGMIESGITRIGAEQEFSLVTPNFLPAPVAMELLEKIDDPHFTNELAKFNMEINLDPQVFTGDALSRMETQLKDCLKYFDGICKEMGVDYVLTGILPTIRESDLELENMTPKPRYFALNDAILRLRAGLPIEYHIEGQDQLITKKNSVMFEACNTSFQVHYQTNAEDFVSAYNWAQAITGPVLSCATNSPLLMGKRLWRETRIALFKQATDTRSSTDYMRDSESRVHFGSRWLENSVLDLFKEDVARYRVLVSSEVDEDSLEVLEKGGVPKLQALNIHNGTIYKWNRACYGISDGKPHLRIENRVLPSGPTVIDEMANTAFWLGLMHGRPKEYDNLPAIADFDWTKINFARAVRMGMGAMFRWVDNKVYTAEDLIINILIPIARKGLEKAKIHKRDIDKYLRVISERVKSGKTGSQWVLDSFGALRKKGTTNEALVAITAGMKKRQKTNKPVHKWSSPKINEAGSWVNRYWRVDQIMSRNIYSVNENDLIDLVPNIMSWKELAHVPVESVDGKLVGLVTSGMLVKYYSTLLCDDKESPAVKDIMLRKVISVRQETSTVDAISLMRKHNIGCLPVVTEDKKLIGIVTERDFVNVADHFLREFVENGKLKK